MLFVWICLETHNIVFCVWIYLLDICNVFFPSPFSCLFVTEFKAMPNRIIGFYILANSNPTIFWCFVINFTLDFKKFTAGCKTSRKGWQLIWWHAKINNFRVNFICYSMLVIKFKTKWAIPSLENNSIKVV